MNDEEKKAIEHLKIVAKERTITPLADEIGIVLNLIEEQQENYQSCMDYADSLNQDIGELLLNLEKKDKIINEMAEIIEECRQNDCLDVSNLDFGEIAGTEKIIKYFEKEVGE